MNRIIVEGNGPLGRYGQFRRFQFFKYSMANCIENMVQSMLLVQQGQCDDAHECLDNPAIQCDPQSLHSWVKPRLAKARIPSTIFNRDDVYIAAMIFLLERGNNPFFDRFVELKAEYINMDPPDDGGGRLKFHCPGDNLIWSCGVNHRTLSRQQGKPWILGLNMYGALLGVVFENFCTEMGQALFSVEQLLSEERCLPISTYGKTVLILSDSISKYVQSVEGGTVIAIGGAHYHRLAREMTRRGLSFWNFRIVIVVCGFNVSPGTRREWADSWRPLNDQLRELRQYPETQVIINGPINCPKAKNVRQHSTWVQERLEADHRSEQIHFCDWSRSGGLNVLVPAAGLIDQRYFDSDGIHVNKAGYKQMLKRWRQMGPDYLNMVDVTLTTTPYAGRPSRQ